MRHQRHPRILPAIAGGFLNRLRDLYSATLAPPTRMDLGFDHNAGCARAEQVLCRRLRSRYRLCHFAARHRDPYFFRIPLAWYSWIFIKIAD